MHHLPPTSHLPIPMPRMDTTQSKTSFGVVDNGSFSMSSLLILPQRMERELTAPCLWNKMHHLPPTSHLSIPLPRMDTPRSKMPFGVVDNGSFPVSSLWILPQPIEREWTAPWLWNCGFGGFQMDFLPPTSHLPIAMPRMDTTRSKMPFGVVDNGSFPMSSLWILPQPTEREWTAPWLSNCGFGGFQMHYLPPTSNLPIAMPRMGTTRSKTSFGVVDNGSFSVSSLWILLQPIEREWRPPSPI
jgi:hypothetical protein